MKTWKFVLSVTTLLLMTFAFVSCSDDKDEDYIEDVNAGIVLDEWMNSGSMYYYNYKELDAKTGQTLVHRLTFSIGYNEKDVCNNAYDDVHFPDIQLREQFLAAHSDYSMKYDNNAICMLNGFVGFTAEEIKTAVLAGDYTGATLKKNEDEPDQPFLNEEDIVGTWEMTRSLGKHQDEDGYVFTSDYTYEEGDSRWFYELNADGSARLWNSKYVTYIPDNVQEYTYKINHYGGDSYGLSMNNGKWHKLILRLTPTEMVLYQESVLMYNMGLTETFKKIQ